MPIGLVTHMIFYEPRDQLFLGGKEGCFIIDLQIHFKYDPSMAILLDAKGTSIQVKIREATEEELRETYQAEQKLKEDSPSKLQYLPINYDADKYGKPDRYGKYIRQLQCINEWVKGLKLFQDQHLVVAWKKEILTNAITVSHNDNQDSKKSKVEVTDDQIIFYAIDDDPGKQYKQGEVMAKFYD